MLNRDWKEISLEQAIAAFEEFPLPSEEKIYLQNPPNSYRLLCKSRLAQPWFPGWKEEDGEVVYVLDVRPKFHVEILPELTETNIYGMRGYYYQGQKMTRRRAFDCIREKINALTIAADAAASQH